MHDLIAKLTEYLSLTPEQQFRVSAMIKRHIHSEKASVFSRYYHYSLGPAIFEPCPKCKGDADFKKICPECKGAGLKGGFDNAIHTGKYQSGGNDWLTDILKAKAEQHQELSKLPDEEVITWDIGTHKYVRKIAPCSVCGCELTGKSYTSIYANGENKTYCPTDAPKEEDEE